MFNGLNNQETPPSQKVGNSLSILEQGFYIGEPVKYVDEFGKKGTGKLVHEGFDVEKNRIVAIEVENIVMKNGKPEVQTMNVFMLQRDFLRENSLEKKQEVKDLADGINNLLN